MTLPTFLMTALWVLKGLIIVDVVLSWVMQPDKFPRSLTSAITDPLYAPIRAILRPEVMGGLDLSPLIILGLIHLMESRLIDALSGAL